jgi:hypothetical protein
MIDYSLQISIQVFEVGGVGHCDGPRLCGRWEDIFYCQLHEIKALQSFDHSLGLDSQNACVRILWSWDFPLLHNFSEKSTTQCVEISKFWVA